MTRYNPKRTRLANGYALLVTLLMLALLAVILGGLAQRSADTALQANNAERAMRQRWAQTSCGYTFLSGAKARADQRIDAWLTALMSDEYTSNYPGKPVASEVLMLKLSGLDIWLRIDDEQSKLNLNHRLTQSPAAMVSPERVIDDALRPRKSAAVRLTREPFVQQLDLPRVMSWAQVLPGYRPSDLLGVRAPDQLMGSRREAAVVDQVSLWGDGKLNIWTADDQVLRRLLSGSVAPETIDELIRYRGSKVLHSLASLIEHATDDKQERSKLSALLTERSDCFSLWLAIRPTRFERAAVDWSLRVAQPTTDDDARHVQEYRW